MTDTARFHWRSDDLELEVEKRNPNKYPAGTPGGRGGQFAPRGMGGGTGAAGEYKYPIHFKEGIQAAEDIFGSREAMEAWIDDVRDCFPSGDKGSVRVNGIYEPTFGRVALKIDMDLGPKMDMNLSRTFKRGSRDDMPHVVHESFILPKRLQGKGISKRVLGRSMEWYDDLGIEYIETLANIDVGGYAWARMGYEPDHEGWRDMRPKLERRAGILMRNGMISQDHFRALNTLIASKDSKSMWKIADMRQGETNVGRMMLSGRGAPAWYGYFEMKDKKARARFLRYLEIKKGNKNKWPAGTPGGRGGQFAPKDQGEMHLTEEEYNQTTTASVWESDGRGGDTSAVSQHLFKNPGTLREIGIAMYEALPYDGEVNLRAVESEHGLEGVVTIDKKSKTDFMERVSATRHFYRDGLGDVVAVHSTLGIKPTGQGHATRFLAKSMEVYQKHGVHRVEIYANLDVGGYAWARMGFEPTSSSWETLRQTLLPTRIKRGLENGDISDHGAAALRELIKSRDPRTLWKIADMREYDNNVGQYLLRRADWDGLLILGNEEHMTRFRRYVSGVKKQLVLKVRRKYPAGTPGGKGGQWMPLEGEAGAAADKPEDQEPDTEFPGLKDHFPGKLTAPWSRMPEEHRDVLNETGLRIHKGSKKEMGSSQGLYTPANKMRNIPPKIQLAEDISWHATAANENESHSNEEASAGVLAHELGHAIDHALSVPNPALYGMDHPTLSRKHAFGNALSDDRRRKWDDPAIQQFKDFYSETLTRMYPDRFMGEMFADLYAAKYLNHRTRSTLFSPEQLTAAFPTSMRVMEELIEESLKKRRKKT